MQMQMQMQMQKQKRKQKQKQDMVCASNSKRFASAFDGMQG